MGYEIICHYKKKNSSDEEKMSLKKRIGDPYEETPIERVASAVMLQLARRDIFVEDVEIFEISKKKISFRETKSGIVIKNKKFIFNDDFEINIKEEINTGEDQAINTAQQTTHHQPAEQPKNIVKRAIRKLIFAPEPQQQIDLLQRGVKLTPDKAYDIIDIKKSPNGVSEIYTLIDDKNREQIVSDICFVPFTNLIEKKDSDGLSWGNLIEDNLPSIR